MYSLKRIVKMANKENCLYLDKSVQMVSDYTPLSNCTIGTIVYEMHVTFMVVIFFLLFFTTVPLVLIGIIIITSLIIASYLFFGSYAVYRVEKLLGGKNMVSDFITPIVSMFGVDSTKTCRKSFTLAIFIVIIMIAIIRLLYLVNKQGLKIGNCSSKRETKRVD